MKEGISKLQLLIKNDVNQFISLEKELSGLIEINRISKDKKSNNISFDQVQETDIIIFDISDEFSFKWSEVYNLKQLNPDLKAILYTSLKNRRYRSYFLSKGVDFFVFKETESALLNNIIKRIHLRKTRST